MIAALRAARLGWHGIDRRIAARASREGPLAVFLHEWRGIGSSNMRASRENDWGYREVLADLAARIAPVAQARHGFLVPSPEQHAPPGPERGVQLHSRQGACPLCQRSSSRLRSRKVSMGCQKPW